jgi:G3E family GTPase
VSGCICCTVRADLITVVKKILGRKSPKLDGIIIETTGLADPAPVGESPFLVQYYSIRLRTNSYCAVSTSACTPAPQSVSAVKLTAFVRHH